MCYADVITSTADLLPYVEGLVAHLTLLGTVLGIEGHANAIENGPGDTTAKCLNILKHWLEVTENPTWNLFCSKLKKDATFNRVRFQIERQFGNHSGMHCLACMYILYMHTMSYTKII